MRPDGPDTLPAGTRLAHYEIRRLLGAGAMGGVYEAQDTALDRLVAVKVVHEELSGEPEVAERFTLESRSAARVVHDNVTHVYFVGTTEDALRRPFYAMELVPGRTLEQLVAADGPLPLAKAVDVLVQAAEGLAAAHAAGVVHRDVKPSNLILRPDGRVKVTDFGLAKSVRGDSGSTQLGSIVGTPDYMSPEQCRGQTVDARADVHLLGLTAFYVLTGERPRTGASVGAVLDEQMNHPLRAASAARPGLPRAVDAVLARLSAKDPADRPQTMREAIALLETLRPRALVIAPIAARIAAACLDALIFIILVGAGETAVRLAGHALSSNALVDWGADLVAFGLLAMVTVVAEWRFGTTIGKRLLHLVVCSEDGTPARPIAHLLRFVIRFPMLPLGLVLDPILGKLGDQIALSTQMLAIVADFLPALWMRGLTLSDVMTGTRVAYRRAR